MSNLILDGEYVEVLESEIVKDRETPKAYAVYMQLQNKKIFMWVPKSQTIKTDKGLYVQAWVFKKNLSRGKAVV